MKSKIIGFFAASLFAICFTVVSCDKNEITKSAQPIVVQQQTIKCCPHHHVKANGSKIACCLCDCVGEADEFDTWPDTLYPKDVVPGVLVEYVQNNSTMYEFLSDSLGHWDTLHTVPSGTYDVRFSKTCYLTQTIEDVSVAESGYHELFVRLEKDPECE